MSFDTARILAVLNNNNVSIGLKKAMFIAQVLMDLHSERVIQVENNTYADAYKRGYEAGKTDTEAPTNFELARLRGIEKMVKDNARELVKEVVREVGSHKKIQCIKELRNKTGLGLKDTKDIVDEYIAKLDGMYLANWERSCLDAAY
ncbi:hypothetical protein AXJ18_gp060 [Streptomyces phage Jay2Jay]|uniref:Large ribosomal subunit protein bL12 C-terminal domain-containing protein n=1 Tax=Streptomyces phage Jay2Jay TaxID=1556290 RepID=A0A0A0RTE7_9CAUD|nr:hypothetical protein AXJ18_gp006 [Streptomyces phage Jay2Jay]YP_009225941.1 hypothetical protein AXJ18_gp060 [Streptomyces phage Jay2Jay]AIW02505.1 hypothetical protein PBI_JAY2JAY_6 [Streptomyces phage Jay2Jay]AIW02714.1 hypothetical protein PBI_JAY2JAY_261 [Streptomyces phage Jay2Jay]